MAKIKVQNTEITVVAYNDNDYISLTDMARSQMQEHIIFRWLSLKSTLEYIGEWEMLYNPSFNCTEFGTIKNMAWTEPRTERQHSWLCLYQWTDLSFYHGELECCVYWPRHSTRWATHQVKPNSHSANAYIGGWWEEKIVKVGLTFSPNHLAPFLSFLFVYSIDFP